MALAGDPPAPTEGLAREADEEELAALDARVVEADAELPEEHRAAVLAGQAHLRAANPGTRRFVGLHDGEPVATTTLFTEGGTAQPEDVSTLPAHRGHGIAGATVALAAREARATGCDLVFLVCDAAGGPVALYASLGFVPVGRSWTFTRPQA